MPTAATAAVLAIALAMPAAAVARPGADGAAISVEPSRVQAGTFYRGATLTVRGSAGAASQVVVLALEPSAPQTYNRRGRIAKIIWGGLEHVTFDGAPGVYYLFTSATIASIAAPEVRARLILGYDTLRSHVRVSGTAADAHAMIEQFVRLKEREGLYRVEPGAVHLGDAHDGRRPFTVAIVLPAGSPPGVFEISVLEFAGGEVVRAERREVPVVRVGLPAGLHRLAEERSLAYGSLAVVVMLVTGLGTGLAGSGRRRVAGRPGEPHAARTTRMAGIAREVAETLRPHGLVRRPPADTAALEDRYHVFRDLLAVNNELLGLLSELEEEASWTSFRQPRVRMEIRALFDGTADLVALLNRLSGDRYFDLANVTSSIRHDVLEFLSELQEQQDTRLTLRQSEIDSATAGRVGGKAVNLARLDCDLAVRVPPFFVITTEAYRTLLDDGGLGSKLRTVLAPARLDAPEDFRRRCELAQSLIDQAPIPPALLASIDRAWTDSEFAADDRAAVRSSAAGEDSELSFAGQFESMLNVHRTALGAAWKQVIRSRFAPRAVFYRRAAGLAEVDTPMAVLVQRMVRASAAGVLFTRQPDDPKAPLMWITSVYGLGSDASIGTANADRLAVSRRPPHHVAERRLARKSERLVSASADGVTRMVVDPDDQLRASVSDELVAALAAQALTVEKYFGRPQDIEWASDADGVIWILQARPLRTDRGETLGHDAPADAPVLIRGGDVVWPGRAVGPVHVLDTLQDQDSVPAGVILVARQLLPDCVRLLPKVCGVIVERGSVTGHAASVLREFHVPSLFGVDGAIDTLVPGQVVSLDCVARRVFAGALWPELRGHIPLRVAGHGTIGLPSMLAGKLTKLSGSSFVNSWACQSLHDVIRFAHEMAIQAMFELGDRLLEARTGEVKRLECPPPFYAHLIDLGGGLVPDAAGKRTVRPDDVRSKPFQALWRGLGSDALERPRIGKPQVGAFASVMAVTSSTSGLRDLGAPNFACISDQYLNLNSRQAYHFVIVDAFLSENQNNNHISLRFKGGGAAPWQRGLRTTFMADVLRLHDFTVSTTGDLLNAWCRGVDQATAARELTMIGHLLRFSAQLDMWMSSETDARDYVRTFVEAEDAALRPPPVMV